MKLKEYLNQNLGYLLQWINLTCCLVFLFGMMFTMPRLDDPKQEVTIFWGITMAIYALGYVLVSHHLPKRMQKICSSSGHKYLEAKIFTGDRIWSDYLFSIVSWKLLGEIGGHFYYLCKLADIEMFKEEPTRKFNDIIFILVNPIEDLFPKEEGKIPKHEVVYRAFTVEVPLSYMRFDFKGWIKETPVLNDDPQCEFHFEEVLGLYNQK
jgi:hypothetical protein